MLYNGPPVPTTSKLFSPLFILRYGDHSPVLTFATWTRAYVYRLKFIDQQLSAALFCLLVIEGIVAVSAAKCRAIFFQLILEGFDFTLRLFCTSISIRIICRFFDSQSLFCSSIHFC